jgi:hypothetical protein
MYKPTSEECRIIRSCAGKSAGTKRIRLEPGMRYNMKVDGVEPHLNIALVTRDKKGDWDDTDLYDFRDWLTFRQGFEVKPGAGIIGIIDFYVSSLGRDGELETNVTAYFDKDGLVRVEGTGNGVMWKR